MKFPLNENMRIGLLYLVTALVGFYWSVSLALAGQYGAPSAFSWFSIVLFTGSVLLAGSAAMRSTTKQHWARWPAVIGSGILTSYFIPAAVLTLLRYRRGDAIASLAQLAAKLALVVPILISFAIAVRELRTGSEA
jgi:hypothetical protein